MSIDIRPLGPSDVEALRAFFVRMPERDRSFFRDDVLRGDVLERWLSEGSARFGAWDGDLLVGYLAVLPLVAWSAHVAEVRLAVDPDHRRRGIGRALARRAVTTAADLGVQKLVVEVVAEQEATVAMFTALGFDAEGLLRDHVRGRDGEVHDLLVLSHFVDDVWASLATTGGDQLPT